MSAVAELVYKYISVQKSACAEDSDRNIDTYLQVLKSKLSIQEDRNTTQVVKVQVLGNILLFGLI